MLPSAKFSVCFVAFALVGSSCAFPNSADPSYGNSVDPSQHHVPAEIHTPVLGDFAHNAEWIFKHLVEIVRSSLKEGFVKTVSFAIDLVVRMEFLTMADGSHSMFPASKNPVLEQEKKVVAIAVSKLLRNLKTMERTDEVIKNVTRTVLEKDAKYGSEQFDSPAARYMYTFLNMYFETMDDLFDGDEVLAAEYKKQKAEAEEVVKRDPKMHEALIKAWEYDTRKPAGKEAIMAFLNDKQIAREAYANKLFMRHAAKNILMVMNRKFHKRYTLARAIIKKAHESSDFDSKVSQVYHKALSYAGGVAYMEAANTEIADTIFDAIQKGLEADPTLYGEIQTLMKEIDHSTTYDLDMFHVDLSPL